MISSKELKDFLRNNDYDLRESGNGRWIDQKCTPDVINIVSDCIFHYIDDYGNNKPFNSVDIWHSQYTSEFVEQIFNKPKINHSLSKNEYDKFFAQPMEMLANAKILSKFKDGNKNMYTVREPQILRYISLHERKALEFIIYYAEHVLTDSEIWHIFEDFFILQSQDTYYKLKESFENFIIKHTKINGRTEVRRIFSKVINPLSYKRRKKGTYRGRISKNKITYSTLMYNQENFRDINIDKPKDTTRQEWRLNHQNKVNKTYYEYQSQKSKLFLREFNDQYNYGSSEVEDKYNQGDATQMHHIFPKNQYPEISMYVENIIAITPTQHFNKAHPNNNTHRIDHSYQGILLRAKVMSIQENIENKETETIYSFEDLLKVLSIGLNKEFNVVENDFTSIIEIINQYYDIK